MALLSGGGAMIGFADQSPTSNANQVKNHDCLKGHQSTLVQQNRLLDEKLRKKEAASELHMMAVFRSSDTLKKLE